LGYGQAHGAKSLTTGWDDLILRAGYQASQDFDAWVLKLGTAGLTLVLGVAALVKTESFTNLVVAGFLFAASLVGGLLSLRLSADGLRRLAEAQEDEEAEKRSLDAADMWQFKWVTGLNWVAFLTLSGAFVMVAVFLGRDAIPMTDGGP
jgi:hypothetical protein